MVLHRTFPVISHHVNRIRLYPASRKGPVVRTLEVGFILLFPIDEELSVSKFNFFVFECNHSLQKCYSLTCKADDHDITSFGFRKEVAKLPTEIHLSVLIGRFHAAAFNLEGSQQMSEDEISGQGNASHPNHKGRGERWKKELENSSVERHGFKIVIYMKTRWKRETVKKVLPLRFVVFS